MFFYDKSLEYPLDIKKPDPRAAQIIISQYGGPNGELGASLRYLSQRYSMPYFRQCCRFRRKTIRSHEPKRQHCLSPAQSAFP